MKTASEQANAALEQGTISKDQYDVLQREIIATEQALVDLEEAVRQGAVMQKEKPEVFVNSEYAVAADHFVLLFLQHFILLKFEPESSRILTENRFS